MKNKFLAKKYLLTLLLGVIYANGLIIFLEFTDYKYAPHLLFYTAFLLVILYLYEYFVEGMKE